MLAAIYQIKMDRPIFVESTPQVAYGVLWGRMAAAAPCSAIPTQEHVSYGTAKITSGFCRAATNTARASLLYCKKVEWSSKVSFLWKGQLRSSAKWRCSPYSLHCNASVQVQQKEVISLHECIGKMRLAVGMDELSGTQITVKGKQCFMGIDGEWTLVSSNGRYYECFNSEELTLEGGYDGYSSWHADFAGRVTQLDLDDKEVSLLASWLRTGYWISNDGLKMLNLEIDEDYTLDPSEIRLLVRFKNSKLVSRVHVNTNKWLITRVITNVFGGDDRWEYSDWRIMLPDRKCRYPCSIIRYPPAGGRDSTDVNSFEISSTAENSLFSMPGSFIVPRHNKVYPTAELDESIPAAIQTVHTVSGHYVVKPLVDGKDVGYFVVDTGASGLSIAPSLSSALSMPAFGELYVTGVESQTRSRYVRGKSIQIGRLKILNPLYIEVSLEGVVRGIEPVAGICGFDLFYHCIVEMNMANGTMSLYDPSNYYFSYEEPWQKLRMLEKVPHVKAKFNGHETLFLLDTGAGGVDVIFPGNIVKEYNLLKTKGSFVDAKVRGVNATSDGVQALYGVVKRFEIGDHEFEDVRALFFKEEGGMMNFSAYTGGIICENILRSFLLVIDYQRCRIAFVKCDSDEE